MEVGGVRGTIKQVVNGEVMHLRFMRERVRNQKMFFGEMVMKGWKDGANSVTEL